MTKNIYLYNDLIVEVEYSHVPEQKESWGYNGGDPYIPAHVEDISVKELISGTIDELCQYIDDQSGDFYEELETKMYEMEDR